MRRLALVSTSAALALVACGGAATRTPAAVVVRVDQVGYANGATKLAYALSTRPGPVAFAVLGARRRPVLRTRSAGNCPAFGPWRGCAVLDFSRLHAPGIYRLAVGGALSPPVRIAATAAQLYRPLIGGAVSFLQSQRDGPDVIAGALGRAPAHLHDAAAQVYGVPAYRGSRLAGPLHPTGVSADLSGGWFDAGDYLKFTGTASFTDTLLLYTLRQYGSRLPGRSTLAAEARFGTDWLLKTWDPARRVLYEQVGLGDGNGNTVLGDHDVWRRPERDDALRPAAERYLARRPVFAANRPGEPVPPNLAGRAVAALSLCSQVFRASDPAYADRCLAAARTLYDASAKRWAGRLPGSIPAAYYPESEWRDDMELGAVELYLASLAVPAPRDVGHQSYHYIEAASGWANQYEAGPRAGADSLNLYDVAALADAELYRAMIASGHAGDLYTNAADVLNDLRQADALGQRLAGRGPLGLADPAAPSDTVAHALGEVIGARLYDDIVHRARFAALAERQLAWVLGANPWGSSFVVGAGSVFPHCLAAQIPNLEGSLTGRGPVARGAVVAGPTGSLGAAGAPDGYRRCSIAGYAGLDGNGFYYRDDVRSPSTSEPTDDLAALSLLAFAQQSA